MTQPGKGVSWLREFDRRFNCLTGMVNSLHRELNETQLTAETARTIRHKKAALESALKALSAPPTTKRGPYNIKNKVDG